jgi:hypothetical protein
MPFTRLRQSLIQPNGSITGSLLGTASYAITSSYAMNGGSGGGSTPTVSVASLNNQTILYNFSSSQEATITGLTLTNNNWGINVVEEWNSGSGDIYYPSCSLLCHFDSINSAGRFIDNSINNFTITSSGDVQLSDSEYKFGGASAYFDGTGDYLTIPSNTALDFGTGSFTIEFWAYFNALSSSRMLAERWTTGNANSWQLYWRSTGTSLTFLVGSSTVVLQDPSGSRITTNQWYHVAVARSGSTNRMFIDGTQVASATNSASLSNSLPFVIGTQISTGTNNFNGYIDEFRITKGFARYTASFTPPISAFPNSATQTATKYIGLVGGLNDTNVDYGIEKLSDSSLKIKKLTDTQQPSGSFLSSSVDRVYVNVLNYNNISAGSTLLGQAFTAVGNTASYALSRSVINPYEIIVAVDGAVQAFNDAYSVTSSTINFAESIPSGSLVDIRYLTTPNVNSASYALTSSYALNGGSGGGTGSTVIIYDVLLNNLYDNVLLTYERKPEQLISIVSNDYGTQADGLVTITTAKNISTDTIASGRTVADGVAYLVTAITSSSSTSNITVSGSSVTGVAVGDEMLLINVQGDTTYYNNVGNYEFLRVSGISTNVISFNSPVSRSYGQSGNSVLGNQKITLQRVPNYSTVTITSAGSLTANNWSGSLGGIVAFKCDTLINSGSINTNGKGFRYGVGGIFDSGAGCTQSPTPSPAGDRAESYQGVNSVAFCSRLGRSATTSIGGGGGGGGGNNSGDTANNRSGGGGGGGANRTNGSAGSNSSYSVNLGGSGGTAYNTSTTLLMFGGGGGGGGRAVNGVGGIGGSGGGIVLIYANNFNNASIIQSTGSRGVNGTSTDDGGGGGGAGAGGAVLVKSNYVNSVGTFSIAGGTSSSGGVGSLYGTGGAGGAGGLGNQLLKYTVANVSVASVTASFESSSLTTTTAVDPNIEDGFVDNYYVYNTLATVVSASWDSINKSYYNNVGGVNSLTSYPIRTISSSVVYPSVVRALIFAENNDDDPWVINQDLKFYLSNNGGVSYTTASLVKRGLYETGKFIYSNDINLTSQNTASLTYRLELSSSKLINVYGTGLIWPIDLTVISSSYTAATASFAFTSSWSTNSFTASNLTTTNNYTVTTLNINSSGSTGTSTNGTLTITGQNTKGGSAYHDFLYVSNTSASVLNPNKYFRLNDTGNLEIINSNYGTNIFTLTDSGSLQLPTAQSANVTQLRNTGAGLKVGNYGLLFDDGNVHLHSTSPGTNLWLNCSGSGMFVVNGQTGASGGMCVGTSIQKGYVTIVGSVSAAITQPYGYLISSGAGTTTGTSPNPYSLTCDNRVMSSEFNVPSDERLKDIKGEISLNKAIDLVTKITPIEFTWKDGVDSGLKAGYSAQQTYKAGFEHLLGVVNRPGLEATTDSDGFINPKDAQFVMNYEQVTPYHSKLIKHLLEKIEILENRISQLENK